MRHEGSTSNRFGRILCGAIGMTLAVAIGASVADARPRQQRHEAVRDETAFDGAWSVVIQGDNGPCAGSYRYGVEIIDGAVTYEGQPYGRVTPNGNVRVRLSMGDQNADGVGRLSLGQGSGVWRGASSGGACSGRWYAQRRGSTTTGFGR